MSYPLNDEENLNSLAQPRNHRYETPQGFFDVSQYIRLNPLGLGIGFVNETQKQRTGLVRAPFE